MPAPHQAIRGEKGYNGVAVFSRLPIIAHDHLNWAGREDCRHRAVTLANGVRVRNFYIPAGGDIPDREANPKFDHKLVFLDALEKWSRDQADAPQVLVGDLNIAPRQDDVWSHKQLLKIISHTPVKPKALTVSWLQGNGLMRYARLSPKASFIHGGHIGRGIGMPPIGAEDLTIYG